MALFRPVRRGKVNDLPPKGDSYSMLPLSVLHCTLMSLCVCVYVQLCSHQGMFIVNLPLANNTHSERAAVEAAAAEAACSEQP